MITSLVFWLLSILFAASAVYLLFEQKRVSAEHNKRYSVGTRLHDKYKPDMPGGLAMVCGMVAFIFGGLGYAAWS